MSKRKQHSGAGATSPYVKYKKRPADYTALYRRILDSRDPKDQEFAKHLRDNRGMR